jgi:REP element-mobilizing transposase RayT
MKDIFMKNKPSPNRGWQTSNNRGWQAARLPHIDLSNHFIFVTCSCIKEYILSELDKDIVFNSILFHNQKMYNLHAAVVMDTHFHIIIEPYASLSKIIHSIKSYSSHKINKLKKRIGKLWMREYFDRVIRSDRDYLEKMNYIINNPLKIDLNDYKWLYVLYDEY